LPGSARTASPRSRPQTTRVPPGPSPRSLSSPAATARSSSSAPAAVRSRNSRPRPNEHRNRRVTSSTELNGAELSGPRAYGDQGEKLERPTSREDRHLPTGSRNPLSIPGQQFSRCRLA
jgi:hypothetical protein